MMQREQWRRGAGPLAAVALYSLAWMLLMAAGWDRNRWDPGAPALNLLVTTTGVMLWAGRALRTATGRRNSRAGSPLPTLACLISLAAALPLVGHGLYPGFFPSDAGFAGRLVQSLTLPGWLAAAALAPVAMALGRLATVSPSLRPWLTGRPFRRGGGGGPGGGRAAGAPSTPGGPGGRLRGALAHRFWAGWPDAVLAAHGFGGWWLLRSHAPRLGEADLGGWGEALLGQAPWPVPPWVLAAVGLLLTWPPLVARLHRTSLKPDTPAAMGQLASVAALVGPALLFTSPFWLDRLRGGLLPLPLWVSAGTPTPAPTPIPWDSGAPLLALWSAAASLPAHWVAAGSWPALWAAALLSGGFWVALIGSAALGVLAMQGGVTGAPWLRRGGTALVARLRLSRSRPPQGQEHEERSDGDAGPAAHGAGPTDNRVDAAEASGASTEPPPFDRPRGHRSTRSGPTPESAASGAGSLPPHGFPRPRSTSGGQGSRAPGWQQPQPRRPLPPPRVVLEQARAELDYLIGLRRVKERVHELMAYVQYVEERRRQGLPGDPITLHMAFLGRPGTGKSEVARIVGRLLYGLRLLRRGHLVEVDRSGLVGEYVGHTALKTHRAMARAAGGVLFIDEAHALAPRPGTPHDFGYEAIDALVKGMEDHRQELVVILAGYPEEMERLWAANAGLRSRVPHHVLFPDYTADELLSILHAMAVRRGYLISKEARDASRIWLAQARSRPEFANARTVRNYLEAGIMRLAARCHRSGLRRLNKAQLITLLPEDLQEPPEVPPQQAPAGGLPH